MKMTEKLKRVRFYNVSLGTCWSANNLNDGGFSLDWSYREGFGEFVFYRKGNQLYCDDEFMSKDDIVSALNHFKRHASEKDLAKVAPVLLGFLPDVVLVEHMDKTYPLIPLIEEQKKKKTPSLAKLLKKANKK